MQISRLAPILAIAVAAVTSSCGWTSRSLQPVEFNPSRKIAPSFRFIEGDRPQCLEMVQDFCQTLFSPENQGSLQLHLGEAKYDIRMGETMNDFSEKDFQFLQAKLRAWNKLPREFRQVLSAHDFHSKLQRHLARSARAEMSLRDRVANMRNEEEINSIWNLAMRETVLTKMEKRFPGYSRIKEDFMPLELRYEAERQRRSLGARVAEAIWSDHPNWREVERKFEKIKRVYKSVIDEHASLTDDIKKDWKQRIESVDLIIPGADPEVEMGSCFKNESNAYYFRDKNYITVCAGDFNTEEIEQTLAHEVGHALDMGRSRALFQAGSSLGRGLAELKEMSCSPKRFSCDTWNKIKETYHADVAKLAEFSPQLPAFNMCLQEKEVTTSMPDEYVARVAKEEVEAGLAGLARRNVFLRVISPELPLPNGTSQKNPMYLNPCGYYLWDTQVEPLDEDVGLLLFFTAEYRCSAEPDRAEKFKRAIETAKELHSARMAATVRMEGKFSNRIRLDRDGYASSPTERFADNLGQEVFARLLNEEQDVRKRRARYMANNAWLCRRPSIQQLFPGEAKIQRSYYVEAHSETSQRQKELLTENIRESLQCKQDFSVRQCKL